MNRSESAIDAAPSTAAAASLRERIVRGDATVGVIGLGYVGLPLGLAFAEKGFRVLGFDVDRDKVAMLSRGESYIPHFTEARIASVVEERTLAATADFDRLAEPDVIVICVPTPLTTHREPDTTFIEKTAGKIVSRLRPGQLVVLESTTYPGTTDGLLREILDESGLTLGRDYFLAYSPEREDPGNPRFTTSTIPKVVGGVDGLSGELAALLYGQVVERVVPVSSARVAEATKLTENVFRAINIALVNELKLIYERMGIDVWEVLDAAETKPFGFMRFDPGPGWGGHCIPLDPFYLSWKAREYGKTTRFIELAGEINTTMPQHVVGRVGEALNEDGVALNGSRILVLGLAYKPNVSDDRESPSYVIMDLLAAAGVDVAYHDPHVPVIQPSREHGHWAGTRSVPWDLETIGGFDAVVVSTAHADVDYDALGRWASRVIDTRNVMSGVSAPRASIWKA